MLEEADPNAVENWNLVIFFDELPPGIPTYPSKSWQKIFYLLDIDTNNLPYEVRKIPRILQIRVPFACLS